MENPRFSIKSLFRLKALPHLGVHSIWKRCKENEMKGMGEDHVQPRRDPLKDQTQKWQVRGWKGWTREEKWPSTSLTNELWLPQYGRTYEMMATGSVSRTDIIEHVIATPFHLAWWAPEPVEQRGWSWVRTEGLYWSDAVCWNDWLIPHSNIRLTCFFLFKIAHPALLWETLPNSIGCSNNKPCQSTCADSGEQRTELQGMLPCEL